MLSSRPGGLLVGFWRPLGLMFLLLSSELGVTPVRAEFSYESVTAVLARINISYLDPVTKQLRSVTNDMGRFADGAIGPAGGVLVQAHPPANASRLQYMQGCVPEWASPPKGERWIALFARGGCSDEKKVHLAMSQNASAVMLFGGDPDASFQKDPKFSGDAVVVYLLRARGNHLSSLLFNGTKVNVVITRGQEVNFRITSINRTSVLFVSVSFIVLMVVSLAWLIFYYIQRFRYINAKDRLARHLSNAAKKALAKIPVKNLKPGEKEMEEKESCAVCIEIYQAGDTVRALPCKHQFHKSCVDPWLLEHRTCPMCKMDILKHYGYITGSEGGRGRGGSGADESGIENSFPSRRATDAAPSSSSVGIRSTTLDPLQISVIAPSEVLPRSPAGDQCPGAGSRGGSAGRLSLPTCHSSRLSTTPAVIRSMILSVRPQAPQGGGITPEDVCGGCPVQEGTDPPISIFEDSRTVSGCGRAPSITTIDETTRSGPTHNIPPTALTQSPVVERREDKASPVPSLGALGNRSDGQVRVAASPGVVSPPPSSVTAPNAEEKRSDYVVYDIECLVKEISDLEGDEAPSDRSQSKSPSDSTSLSYEESEEVDKNAGTDRSKNLPSSCVISPGIRTALPKVDCEAQTQMFPVDDTSASYGYSPIINRSTSSIPSDDSEDPKRRDSLLSAQERRASSGHVITITHS